MKIASYAVKHPVVIGMLVIALVAFGFYCVFGMNLEFLPDISLPEVEVVTIYPGASAEDVEKDITKILEDDFATLPNYKSMTSQSMNSMSWITITYSDGVDPYEQLTDLRYRISQLKDDLPEDAYEPVSIVGGASMLPIMTFAVKGGSDTSRIMDYIEDTLKPRLTRIEGVSEIAVYGASELEIQVKLRMDDILSKGISVLQVYQVLNYSDKSIPLGNAEYRGKTINVKYDGSIGDIEQLKQLPVGATAEGTIIRLGDVAYVDYGYKKQDIRIMDESSSVIMVTVSKRASGNTVKICRQIRSVLDGVSEDTDGALSCKVFSDDSKSVKNSLLNVLESGILGVLIAVAVIFLFLNDARSTLVIGISIPLSILFTFIAMKITGATINLMTTASFVVALGMIVDGSICMIEQISRYLGKDGYTTLQAIERGSSEVGPSITASVLTTVVVFLPICFLKGIMGMILTGFAQVLIFCMLASLLVSVVVVPWLMSLISMIHLKHRETTFFTRAVDKLEKLYRRGLSWSLNHKTYVILVPIFMLVLAAGMVTGLGYSFIPSVDTGEFYINVQLPEGYDLERTEQKMDSARKMVEELVPEQDGIAVYLGMDTSMGSGLTSSPNKAYMYVMLKTGKRRSVQDIVVQVQKELSASIPDAEVTVTNGGFDRLVSYISDGGGYKLKLVGTDLQALYDYASLIRAELEKDSSVMQTEIDTDFSQMLLSVNMDQDSLSAQGITSYEAGMICAVLFNGVELGEHTRFFLSSDIAEGGVDLQMLNRISVPTAAGGIVSFADLGDLKMDKTVSTIKHSERAIAVTVGATLISEDTSKVNERVSAWLEKNPLPEGIATESAGIMGLIEDSIGDMEVALVIAVFLVFSVMVIQFERFKQPFIIFLSIPFCMIGVIVSLLIFGSSMTLMGAVSLIALAGIVVNSAIILIDYINQIRDRKSEGIEDLDAGEQRRILYESVEEGGSSRLRPILMTTLTTIVGMLPMALAVGEGSELYASVGQAIAGGLLVSTAITLFLVPVLYYVFENKQIKKKERRGKV